MVTNLHLVLRLHMNVFVPPLLGIPPWHVQGNFTFAFLMITRNALHMTPVNLLN
jgi:hypothetical protein